MQYGNNLTYAKRVIEIYDSAVDVADHKFTLITNTILGILSSICPDGQFLISLVNCEQLPKISTENPVKYLKRIRNSLSHKTAINFKDISISGEIESIRFNSTYSSHSVELNLEELSVLLNWLRDRIIST